MAIRGLRKEKVLKNKSKQVGAQLACNCLGKGSCRDILISMGESNKESELAADGSSWALVFWYIIRIIREHFIIQRESGCLEESH